MDTIEYLQYSRKQYGIKQYGRYPGPVDEGEKDNLMFRTARIRAVKNGEKEDWIIQHRPVNFTGEPYRVRIKTNNDDFTYAQKVMIPGQHKKVRLRTAKDEIEAVGI